MIAQDELETAFRVEARYGNPVKWALLLASLLFLGSARHSFLGGEEGWSSATFVLLGYAAFNLLFTLAFIPPPLLTRWRLPTLPASVRRALLSASYLVDYLYISALVGLTGGFQSDLYILYAVLALKSAIYYPYVRELVVITFFSGGLWVLVAFIQADSLFFLADDGFIGRYVALYSLIMGSLLISWIMERRQHAIHSLGENLTRKSEDLEAQARIVQRTAADLANRLLELRSLQESAKAINSALALDELLQRVVENATQVLRGARCTIALVDEKSENVITSAASGVPKEELSGTCFRIGEGVAGWVVANREPALIHDVEQDARFRPTGGRPIASLVSVPLISDTAVVGALTATSPEPHAFTEADVNLLDAFGDQAVIAVKNARLYEQLVQEEKETARLYQSVLEKSNELEAVLRGIGDGVLFVDADLHLLMMNPVAARMFGVSQVPQQGVRLPEIIDCEPLIAMIRETLAEEEGSLIREITLDRDEQHKAVYQALSSTVRGASAEIRGVVTVLRDITSQKEIDQIKSDFLSVVSHELRTPLHSIKGFVDIILMGKTGEINELQRDFLTTVKEATANLQRLIDDLLEFSRMEAGQVKLKPQMISVYDIAQRVVEQVAPLAQDGQLTLMNQISADLPLIEADPLRIEQVVTNLVSNAIKFTPPNGSVTISAIDLGERIRVSVTDTGIGVPETEQEHIFQRFYQVDGSSTRSYRGAGLGLTICKFIIEYHHGQIWIESKPGEGSTFHFELPKCLPKDEDMVIDFTVPAARRG